MEDLAKSDLLAPAMISVEKIAKASKMVKLAVDPGNTKSTVVAVMIGEFTPTAESHCFSPDVLWSGLWSGCRSTKSRRSRSETAKLSGAAGLPSKGG